MKNKPTVLDEMQDKKLLNIEESGFWLVFWTLAAAIVIQALIGAAWRELIGEFAALLIASGYLVWSCLKNGLWTRSCTPSHRSNAIAGVAAALLLGLVHAIRVFVVLKKPAAFDSLLPILLVSAGAFVLCFALLEVFSAIHSKRRAKLDDTEEDGES